MKSAFKRAHKRMTEAFPNFGAAAQLSEREWWIKMIRTTLEEAGCLEALETATFPLVFQRIYSAFGSRDVWEEKPEGLAAMRHAKEAGLVVGVICNCYHRYVDNNMPLLGLHRDLDFAVVSHDVDVAKPSAGIFEVAQSRAAQACRLLHGDVDASLAAGEMLHIGDNLENDFLAAKDCGMQSLLLDATGRTVHEKLSPDDVVQCLSQVPDQIDRRMRFHGFSKH